MIITIHNLLLQNIIRLSVVKITALDNSIPCYACNISTFKSPCITREEFVRFRLNGKEKDLAALESRLMSAESQVNELQARVSDAVNQRRHFEDASQGGLYRQHPGGQRGPQKV